ncbi:predicted protein [Histoplasma capsulatum G186AR]|uniref:Uncharacterized protein n=1 Tax=Ajellomyces capsulatus (strain G186AR / H82 / ATCC MYA-2454 / RMSCC 2432) TaxID=447093 RepID=C0NW93_AJECG|nr:uncharacterized protein HCBG_07423 [Histoplasma capsulatum G186AR]EEH04198.1 predicted protein [Histoplasma capsulatum G186AR]
MLSVRPAAVTTLKKVLDFGSCQENHYKFKLKHGALIGETKDHAISCQEACMLCLLVIDMLRKDMSSEYILGRSNGFGKQLSQKSRCTSSNGDVTSSWHDVVRLKASNKRGAVVGPISAARYFPARLKMGNSGRTRVQLHTWCSGVDNHPREHSYYVF